MLGLPSPLLATDVAGTISMPRYAYVLSFAGTERSVTEVCAECLELLTQMADQFPNDQENRSQEQALPRKGTSDLRVNDYALVRGGCGPLTGR